MWRYGDPPPAQPLPRVEHINYYVPPCGDATHAPACMCHHGRAMARVNEAPSHVRAFAGYRALIDDARGYAELAYLHAELTLLRARFDLYRRTHGE